MRGAKFFTRPFAAGGGKAIEMARGSAGGGGIFPAGFKPSGFVETHEDGIKGAGSQVGGLAESVAVMPVRGLNEERVEKSEGLAREA